MSARVGFFPQVEAYSALAADLASLAAGLLQREVEPAERVVVAGVAGDRLGANEQAFGLEVLRLDEGPLAPLAQLLQVVGHATS